MRLRPASSVVAIALALGLGACSSEDGEAAGGATSSGNRSAAAIQTEEVVHLHGIGRNPADGAVYLATHAGLVRLTPDGFEVIAGRFQDTMGFAIAGADEFLGSGHPDLREDAPSHLGLIRSEDRGMTWSSVSLSGEADFHAIVLAHGRVFAADSLSGRLLVSSDGGASWDERGEVALAALAVDPDDPERLVGADYEGALFESEDGGESWTRSDGPTTVALLWHSRLGLLAASGDGIVSSRDDGGSWQTLSSLDGTGPVLAADGTGVLAATDGGRIVRSEDARTWEAAG
jgi:photosystem II stability/assembly factor-like uncharacterized protein